MDAVLPSLLVDIKVPLGRQYLKRILGSSEYQ